MAHHGDGFLGRVDVGDLLQASSTPRNSSIRIVWQKPIKVLRGYLATRAATDKTSSNMLQIISTCRLCEELALVDEFVPQSIWRMVRGKDRLAGRGSSQGWGSLEVLQCMAKRASRAEDKIVVALAVPSIIYCLRISEAASIRSIDLVQDEAFVRFYDFKCKDKWIKHPAGVHVCRIIRFIRLQMAIQGRRVALPVFSGGAKKLGQAMARLLSDFEFRDLRWHCWRRAGATMFTRPAGSMCELMALGRWRSLRVARKYVAKWDALPWTGGVVPWPQVEMGTTSKWRYGFEPFRAREFWPKRQFMRDDGWETEGSDAEGVGKCVRGCGDTTSTADVGQGVKRAAQVGTTESKAQSSVKGRHAVGSKSRESNKR